jgi:4-hydroxy-2-oxoheptanedioate aldolase
MLEDSPLKKKLESGKPVIGTWNTLAAPLATEVMAQAGFDFQIIDLEHGPFVLNEVFQHVHACRSSDCSPIVRVPDNESWMVLQALDQGAHGVIVPHIESAEDARRLVEATKYHPAGSRGFTPFSSAGGFIDGKPGEYPKKANTLTLSAIIIESQQAMKHLDQILELPEIDVVYFGAYDLSQALGRPGDVRHPDVISAISQGVERTLRAGKHPGGFVAQSEDDIRWLLDMGMRFITYEVDCAILFRKVRDVVTWFGKESR